MKIKIYYYSFNTVCALISSCAEDDFVETVGVCPVVNLPFLIIWLLSVPFNQIISVTFNEK
jgi:hypothetical protein